MAIGIDPLVDFAAKRLLGSPEHSRITLHFLNAMLGFADPIVEVTIQNPINLKDFDTDKLSILDIKVTDSMGRRYTIEVQTTRPLGLPKRLTYYAAKQLTEQLGEGDQYADLNASISICILDAVMFRGELALQHAFQLWSRKSFRGLFQNADSPGYRNSNTPAGRIRMQQKLLKIHGAVQKPKPDGSPQGQITIDKWR